MEVKFKNGSYIKTIESNESQRVSNTIKDSAKDFDALSSFLAMAEDDRTIYFIERYMGVKLLPFQKMLIRITNKVNQRRNDMEIEKYTTETEQINDGSEVFTASLDCEMDLSEFYEKRNGAMFSFLDLLVKMITFGNDVVRSLESVLAEGKTISTDSAHAFAEIINTVTDVAKYTFEDDD